MDRRKACEDVAERTGVDLEEVEDNAIVFETAYEAFYYIHVEESSRDRMLDLIREMADITPDELGNAVSNVAHHMLITDEYVYITDHGIVYFPD